MLDEMLDWFASLQNFQILKKEEKKCVGWCWMKFDRHQTFHPTFAARSKNVIFSYKMWKFECRKSSNLTIECFILMRFETRSFCKLGQNRATRKNVLQQWRRYRKRKSICSNQRGNLIEIRYSKSPTSIRNISLKPMTLLKPILSSILSSLK